MRHDRRRGRGGAWWVSDQTSNAVRLVYDVILLIGSSKESWEKAAANAVKQASKSLRNLRVAEIVELDMQLDAKGKVEAYRAKVRLSFKVELLKTKSTPTLDLIAKQIHR